MILHFANIEMLLKFYCNFNLTHFIYPIITLNLNNLLARIVDKIKFRNKKR